MLQALHDRSRRRKLTQLLEEFRPGPRTRLLEVGFANTEPLSSTNYLIKHYPHRDGLKLRELAHQAGMTHFNVCTHALLGWPFAVTLTWHED